MENKIWGSEIEYESGSLREMVQGQDPARLLAKYGGSDLKLIGQVSLCPAGVDLNVICGLLQLIVPLRLGHLDLTQVLSRHFLLLGFGLLFIQKSGGESEQGGEGFRGRPASPRLPCLCPSRGLIYFLCQPSSTSPQSVVPFPPSAQ